MSILNVQIRENVFTNVLNVEIEGEIEEIGESVVIEKDRAD